MCKTLSIVSAFKKNGLFVKKNEILAYWWHGENNRNFGDIITPYLIEKISGKKAVLCSKHCLKKHYLFTGSILKAANNHAVIWGSGIMSEDELIRKPKEVLAVRGPLSRDRLVELGYNCPNIFGDPALLLPRFYTPLVEKKYELGIIPHYVDFKKINALNKSDTVKIIDLLQPVETVIDDISSCKQTISSSLHGIIVSHAYGINSIWVKFSDKLSGDGTKFNDYFLSVGISPYKPIVLNDDLNISQLIQLAQKRGGNFKIDTNDLINACPLI